MTESEIHTKQKKVASKKELHHPNDHLFRYLMSNLMVAKDWYGRHVSQFHLEVSEIDFDTSKLEKGEFVDELLKKHEVDVLHSVRMKNHQKLLLWLHVELQSQVDKSMPIRMEMYKSKMMDHYHRLYSKEPLPIVLPFVLYVGKARWSAKNKWTDLTEDPKLAQEIDNLGYQLIDIARENEEEMCSARLSGLLEYVFFYRLEVNKQRALNKMLAWARELTEEGIGLFSKELGIMILRWLLAVTPSDALSDEALKTSVREHWPELQGEVMNLERAIIKKHVDQTRIEERILSQKMVQEAEERVKQKRNIEMAKNLLIRGLSDDLIMETLNIEQDDLFKLKRELGEID